MERKIPAMIRDRMLRRFPNMAGPWRVRAHDISLGELRSLARDANDIVPPGFPPEDARELRRLYVLGRLVRRGAIG